MKNRIVAWQGKVARAALLAQQTVEGAQKGEILAIAEYMIDGGDQFLRFAEEHFTPSDSIVFRQNHDYLEGYTGRTLKQFDKSNAKKLQKLKGKRKKKLKRNAGVDAVPDSFCGRQEEIDYWASADIGEHSDAVDDFIEYIKQIPC